MKVIRKSAESMDTLVTEYIDAMGLRPAHNKYRIDRAWEQITNSTPYIVRTWFKDGIYYVTMNSSAARSMLSMQKDILTIRLNEALGQDTLFKSDSKEPIKKIVLK